MGKPAARISDMHVCPMVTGIVPHVGGPILPPGTPTVLIGGLPAATATNMCVCTGPPDIIALGSAGVFIGGLPAARMGDMTAHGGSIVMGLPTVLIGEVGGGSAGGAGSSPMNSAMKNNMSKVLGADQLKDLLNEEALAKAAANGDGLAPSTEKKDISAQFTLLDEAGKALSGVRYQIETTDKAIHTGSTDGSGKTSVLANYSPGNCKVSFLDK